jgi:hypothetical protein
VIGIPSRNGYCRSVVIEIEQELNGQHYSSPDLKFVVRFKFPW